MIGLLAQNILLSDQLVLLTKQSLFAGKSCPQQAFRELATCQLAFIAYGVRGTGVSKWGPRLRALCGKCSRVISQAFHAVSGIRRLTLP
jgi:hypothetical protein